MATAKKKSGTSAGPISVKYWLFAIFIALLPPINIIMVPLLALFSRDQSKRNFYIALILGLFLQISLGVAAIMIVAGPKPFSQIWEHYQEFRKAPEQPEDSPDSKPILVKPNSF